MQTRIADRPTRYCLYLDGEGGCDRPGKYVVDKPLPGVDKAFDYAKKYLASQDREGLVHLASQGIRERAKRAAAAATRPRPDDYPSNIEAVTGDWGLPLCEYHAAQLLAFGIRLELEYYMGAMRR